MGWLMDRIKIMKDAHGASVRDICTDKVVKELQDSTRLTQVIRKQSMRSGRFYFVFYDVDGKSTDMEKFSPMLLVDAKRINNITILYGISFNFIPLSVRIAILDSMTEAYSDTVQKNIKEQTTAQEARFSGFNFEYAHDLLSSVGFEYALREFTFDKVHRVIEVSTAFLDSFACLDTYRFTGVDEGKLGSIWLAKLKTRDARNAELLQKLLSSYSNMQQELKTGLNNIAQKQNSLDATNRAVEKIIASSK